MEAKLAAASVFLFAPAPKRWSNFVLAELGFNGTPRVENFTWAKTTTTEARAIIS